MEVKGKNHAPVALPPEKEPLVHIGGERVSSRAGMDTKEKRKVSFPVFQPIAQSLHRLSYPGCIIQFNSYLLRTNLTGQLQSEHK
jgi:hypothetical protein